MATPATAKRLTRAEAIKPITDCTCGKCGRTDATIYPFPDTRGIFICFSCSPSWLVRWMRDWSDREAPVAL